MTLYAVNVMPRDPLMVVRQFDSGSRDAVHGRQTARMRDGAMESDPGFLECLQQWYFRLFKVPVREHDRLPGTFLHGNLHEMPQDAFNFRAPGRFQGFRPDITLWNIEHPGTEEVDPTQPRLFEGRQRADYPRQVVTHGAADIEVDVGLSGGFPPECAGRRITGIKQRGGIQKHFFRGHGPVTPFRQDGYGLAQGIGQGAAPVPGGTLLIYPGLDKHRPQRLEKGFSWVSLRRVDTLQPHVASGVFTGFQSRQLFV